MSTNLALGRELNDTELEKFHGGGTCDISFVRNGNGQVIGVKTSGDCDNVVINVTVQ